MKISFYYLKPPWIVCTGVYQQTHDKVNIFGKQRYRYLSINTKSKLENDINIYGELYMQNIFIKLVDEKRSGTLKSQQVKALKGIQDSYLQIHIYILHHEGFWWILVSIFSSIYCKKGGRAKMDQHIIFNFG